MMDYIEILMAILLTLGIIFLTIVLTVIVLGLFNVIQVVP